MQATFSMTHQWSTSLRNKLAGKTTKQNKTKQKTTTTKQQQQNYNNKTTTTKRTTTKHSHHIALTAYLLECLAY